MTENTSLIIRGENEVQKIGWKVVATTRTNKGHKIIEDILKKFKLDEILYYPNLLIEKNNEKLFVIFSQKEKFVISTKKGIQRTVSGIDWFKYQLAKYIEEITGIQVGLIMYSKETNDLVIRQMNQLPLPDFWFKGDGCLLSSLDLQIRKPSEKKAKRLKKVFKDPEIIEEEAREISRIKGNPSLPLLNCMKCYEEFPAICFRCIKGRHKAVKVIAIWSVNEFQQGKLTVQPQMFLGNNYKTNLIK